MIIPYKVKNPPKHFPIATVCVIGLNIIIFAASSHSFLVVRKEIVEQYALTWGASGIHTMLTSVFLHGDIFHLLGNMLFLWVFGPAVEDRLRIPAYLGLYFLAGFAGHVAQVALGFVGTAGVHVPILGASGCIMGVLGAYWYMYSWSPVCMFYWLGIFWRGTFELAAIWVIGIYFVLDLTNGFIGRSAGATGGVANFAHVGGALVGAMLVAGLGFKRDSGEVSKAKAAHAEYKDRNMLSCQEFWKLLEASPDDEELLAEYTCKAVRDGYPDDVKRALDLDTRAVCRLCPDAAAHYVLSSGKTGLDLPPGEYLGLGKWSESAGRPDQALAIYAQIEGRHPESPEMEHALYRTAWILWTARSDGEGALKRLKELLEKFPTGRLMFEAEDLRDDIMRKLGRREAA